MSEEIKQVQAVSDSVKYAIRRKSAYSLPTNPSERGMTPDEIRRAFYAPITEATQSVLAELDRVVGETNEALQQLRENGEADVAELRSALDTFKEKVDKTVEKYASALDTLNDHVNSLSDEVDGKVERENPTTEGTMTHTGDANFTALSAEELTVPRLNEAYADIERNKSDLEQSKLDILSLRAEVSGKGRIFCLEDFLSLVDFLRYGGTGDTKLWLLENGETVYYTAADLKTGDVIYIKELHVPDVWWISTASAEGAYVYSYNETEYELVGYQNGAVIGQVQPLETDYMVIEGHAQSASLSAQKATDEAARAEEQADRAMEEADRAAEEKSDTIDTAEELVQAVFDDLSVITLRRNAVIELSQCLEVPAYTVIHGNGATIKRATGYEGVLIQLSSNCTISDVLIDGNRENMVSPTWDKTIEIATRENCIVENVTIDNGNEAIIAYCDNTVIRDCEISNCGGNGIHFSGGNHIFVEHCKVINTNLLSGMGHEDGGIIWSDQCDHVTCIGNYIENAKSAFGALGSIGNSNVKIIGNTGKNCTYAVEGIFQDYTPKNVIISENHFFDCGEIAFDRTSEETLTEGNWVISGNFLDNTRLFIDNIQNVTISNNIMIDLSRPLEINKSRNVVLNGNRISGSSENLVYVGDSSFINILGNNISGSGVVVNIQNSTNGIILKGNTIEGTSETHSDACVFVGNGGMVMGNRVLIKSGVGFSMVGNSVCTDNMIICGTSDLTAIRVWGGYNNYIVSQNLTNGVYSISSSATAFVGNNLTCDLLNV